MRDIGIHVTLLLFYWTQTLAIAAPHDEGIAAGNAANPDIRGAITQSGASSVVPGYTATPPETAYYGQPSLAPAANARMADCALAVNDPVCEAQRGALASANTPRPAVAATDSTVAAAKSIMRDPSLALTDLSSYYAGCATPGACPGNVFCVGASCFNTSYTNDADFARAMSFMEAAREAGVYLDTGSMQVFKGEQNHCRDRLLKNCCYEDAAGAGMTNQSLFGTGSRLVYDVLMNSDNRQFIYQGVQALLTSGGFSGSFTSYGVTVAVNGTALPAGSVTLATTDSLAIAFDPWSLAVTAIFYIVMSMSSCNEEEGKLALKEGAHLCHTIGSWCSSCLTLLGKCVSCLENTTSTCCFNSVLARIINEQGRIQVGKGWGNAETPDCSGFTVAQLQSLDFAAMDLTEFYASIVPAMPDIAQIRSSNAARVAQLIANPTPTPPPLPLPAPSPKPTPTPAPPPTSTPPAAPAPSGDIGPYMQDASRYTLAFQDEFDGTSLDTSKWNDHIWYDPPSSTNDYGVSGGSLKIWPQPDASGRFNERILTTDGKYFQTYGYFEMEARLPVGAGVWPAFWLLNSDSPPGEPEIDVMEAYSGDKTGYWADGNQHPIRYGATYFQNGANQPGLQGTSAPFTGDLSTAFHKYAVQWEPDKVSFYFDGQLIYSANVSMPRRMYILVDLQYGSASGAADSTTPIGPGNAFEINYIRAWSFK